MSSTSTSASSSLQDESLCSRERYIVRVFHSCPDWCGATSLKTTPTAWRALRKQHLCIADYDFDIFAVTETWLRGDDYDQYYIRDICPDGYKFYHIPRIHSTGGGVGVVLKDSFRVETIPRGHYGSFESIELTLKISGFFVCLIVLYCSPGLSTSLFFDDFSHYLNYVSTTPGYLLLVGDFNLHVDASGYIAKRFVNYYGHLIWFSTSIQKPTLMGTL